MPQQDLILRLRAEGGTVVVGELEGIGKATGEAERATASYGRTATKSAEGVGKLHLGFGRLFGLLKTGAGLAGFAAIGGIGVAAIKNAQAMQVAQAQLGVSVKQAGIYTHGAAQEMTAYTEKLSTAGGFAAPDAMLSLSQFVRVTDSVTESQKDLSLATDISRARGKDLTTVTRALMLAEQGHIAGLTRLGIVLPKTATATQGLAILQQRYGGSTAAYAHTASGAISSLRNLIENATAHLGEKLAPAITKVAQTLGNFVTQMQSGKGTGGEFVKVLKRIWDILHPLVDLLFRNWQIIVVIGGAVLAMNAAWKAYLIYQEAVKVATIVANLLFYMLTGSMGAAEVAAGGLGVAIDAIPFIGWAAAIITVLVILAVLVIKCKAFRDFIVNVFTKTFDFVRDHWKLILAAILAIFTGGLTLWVYLIATHLKQIVKFFENLPGEIAKAAKDFWNGLVKVVETGAKDVVNAIVKPFKAAFDWITKNNPVAKVIGGAAHAIGSTASSIVHKATHPWELLGLQGGGHVTGSGWAMVGEQGPEIVGLPAGANVYPHGTGPRGGGAGGGSGAGPAILAVLRQILQVEEAALAQGQSVSIDGRQVALAMSRVGNITRAMQ